MPIVAAGLLLYKGLPHSLYRSLISAELGLGIDEGVARAARAP